MKLLAICGSLRAQSSNGELLRAALALAPAGCAIVLDEQLGRLPLFNPDLEAAMPVAVQAWRAAIADADGLLISSPEYAHGISGALKNALDWLVSGPEFVGKPVALLHASTRAEYAPAQLAEILRTMSAQLVDAASLSLPLLGTARDHEAILADAAFAESLRTALAIFATTIATLPAPLD